MDKFDFASQPPAPRDRIYVSFNEQWELDRYVDDYLRSRRLRIDNEAHQLIRECIADFTAQGPLRKADMDYFLDANVRKQLEHLPTEAPRRRGFG